MNIFNFLTPITYWILILLWSFILVFYIKQLRLSSRKGQLISILLIILAIDAFRTLFESIYFGAWYTALEGFLPIQVHSFLIRPEMVFIPKLINVIAAVIIIAILIYRWIPQEEIEKEIIKKLIDKRTSELKKTNEKLQTEINERKQAQEELQKKEAQYRLLAENSTDMIWTATLEGKVTYISPSVQKLSGYSQKEAMEMSITDYAPWETAEKAIKILEKELSLPVEKRSTHKVVEGEMRTKDGTLIDIELNATWLLDEQGEVVGIQGATRNITDRKQNEKVIKRNESFQSKMLANIGDVIVIIDKDGINRFKSPNIEKLFGWKPEEVTGISAWDNVHPEDQESTQNFFKTLMLEPDAVGTTEGRYKCKDGTYRWIEFTGSNFLHDPDIRGILGNYHDINDRKEAEQLLVESESRFKALHNASFGGIAIHDKGIILDCNHGMSTMTGYSIEELMGMDGLLLIAEKSRNFVMDKILSGYEKPYEAIGLRKNGEEFPMRLEARNIPYKGKNARTVEFRDITDRKHREAELLKQKLLFETMFNTIPDGVVITNTQREIQLVNKGMASTFGYKPEDLLGNSTAMLYADQHKYNETGTIIFDKNAEKSEDLYITAYRDKIGREFPGETFGAKLFDETGQWVGNLGIIRDITQRRQSEEKQGKLQYQLMQAQKMESIGTLAGGIAHDFNNILSSIIGFTELALDDVEKGSNAEDSLQEVYTAGKRARDLVKQILTFARQSDEQNKPIQPSVIVKEVINFIRSSIPVTVEIKHEIDSDSLIMGNTTQIHQILMNLCTNAAHAMEAEGGILDVSLKDITVDESSKRPKSDLKFGDYIELKVTDTGTGIAPEMIDSIFEPYFTTKATGEGTGMGLAMVHGIVESYAGKITVDSTPGKGSVFSIYLPITKKRGYHQPYADEKLPSGTEQILFVDDEPAIAKMGSQILERLGYQVTVRTSSVEALELFRTKPDDFDLVITDMTMPNMTGDKMALELMNIRPDIPIILCTGYSNKITDETAAEIGIKGFAYKPVVKSDLAKTVRKVLDETK